MVMSPDLEQLCTSIFNNQVPEMWAAKAYPSLKPLSSWVADLLERCAFISNWIAKGSPAVYWISGFFFPQVGARARFPFGWKSRPDLWRRLWAVWKCSLVDCYLRTCAEEVLSREGCYEPPITFFFKKNWADILPNDEVTGASLRACFDCPHSASGCSPRNRPLPLVVKLSSNASYTPKFATTVPKVPAFYSQNKLPLLEKPT